MTKRTLMIGLAVAAMSVFVVTGARLARSSAVDDDAFAALDTNRDGYISRDEMTAAAEAGFARNDANGDGQLTADELSAARERVGVFGQSGGEIMSISEQLKRMDTNGDRSLSRDEYVSGSLKLFDEMDTNHDGLLSREELAAGQVKLRNERVQDDKMAPKLKTK
ncbi:MAG TPA: EF-hand domain-containing protein [Polyangia bacterium]|nr:EF-hand domain-containing protein [Polyangia bacterium]